MISTVLRALEQGLSVMRLNSRLLLVGVLVFVFPLLFVWVTQSFFSAAYNNINTAEKQRVAMMQDTLATIIKQNNKEDAVTQSLIDEYTTNNNDIVKIRIVDKVNDEFIIIQANSPDLVGTVEASDDLYRGLPLSGSQGSFIFETVINGSRVWQVLRSVSLDDNDLYIFSEHSFGVVDSVMSARRQQSYFGLTGIFLFLIALAYWLNKQVSWEKNHNLLQKQLEARDSFSNMIAHEFRSPLTAIKGYASFLEESKTLEPEDRRFANNIKISAERLVVMVSDFLEVARLQSGKLSIKTTSVELDKVIQQVVIDLQIMATSKGLSLVFKKNESLVVCNTDADRMTQVLTNIITNAIKYTEEGAVEIECVDLHNEVVIRVKDTGSGISAADQQKLFAPFTRVGSADSSNVTGSGLGMWITRQLVDLLGGTIGVESIEGVGTHIVLRFKR